MIKDPITVKPSTTVKEVAKLLFINHFSGMPVVNDENEVVGIVTEGDIVMQKSKIHLPDVIQILDGFIYPEGTRDLEAEMKKITAITAEELMTTDVVTISPDNSVEDLATLITEKHVNPVPVVGQDNKLAGIVSKSDLVWLLAKDVIKKKKR